MTTPLYSHILECLKCVKQQYKWVLLKDREVCVEHFSHVSGKLEDFAWKMSQCNTFPAFTTTPLPPGAFTTTIPLIEGISAALNATTTFSQEATVSSSNLITTTTVTSTSLPNAIIESPATTTTVTPDIADSFELNDNMVIGKLPYYTLLVCFCILLVACIGLGISNIIYFPQGRPRFHDILMTVMTFFGRIQARGNGIRRDWMAREDLQQDATVRADMRQEHVVIEGLNLAEALTPATDNPSESSRPPAIPLMMANHCREVVNSSNAIEMTSFRNLETRL